MRRIIPISSGPYSFQFNDDPGGIANGIGTAISTYLSTIPQRAQIELQRQQMASQTDRQDRRDRLAEQQYERQVRLDEARTTEEARHHRALESVPHHVPGMAEPGSVAPPHVVTGLTTELVPVPKVDLLGQAVLGPDGQPVMEYRRQPRKDAADRLRKARIDPDTLRYLEEHADDPIGGLFGGALDPISSFLSLGQHGGGAPAAPAAVSEGQETMPATDEERAELNELADESALATGATAPATAPAPAQAPAPGAAPVMDFTPAGLAQQQDALGSQVAQLEAMTRHRAPAAAPSAPEPQLQQALAQLHPEDQAAYQRVLASGDPAKIAIANQRLLQLVGGVPAGVR